MYTDKIGVIVDSYRTNLTEGIKRAADDGINGVQIYAVSGEMEPDSINKTKRRELLSYIKDNGMVVTAICGDLGGHGFAIKENNSERIEKTARIIELASDMETNVVTTHIGVIPDDISCERYEVLHNACEQLEKYADMYGCYIAIETGPEKTVVLKSFLDSLSKKLIAVNYDPANLVMVTDDDPVKGVYELKDYIVHTHAKDGIIKKKTDPKIIYDYFAEGGIEDMRLEDYFLETPLGKGDVDFDSYLNALKDIGYEGYLTIEREVGDDPSMDILQAVQFLREKIKECNL